MIIIWLWSKDELKSNGKIIVRLWGEWGGGQLHLKADQCQKYRTRKIRKELSFCHKLYFSNLCYPIRRRPLIFQTMNSVRPNNISLKYQRFTSSDCKDIGIRQFEFVTKTQFLCSKLIRLIPFLCKFYFYCLFIKSNNFESSQISTILV